MKDLKVKVLKELNKAIINTKNTIASIYVDTMSLERREERYEATYILVVLEDEVERINDKDEVSEEYVNKRLYNNARGILGKYIRSLDFKNITVENSRLGYETLIKCYGEVLRKYSELEESETTLDLIFPLLK